VRGGTDSHDAGGRKPGSPSTGPDEPTSLNSPSESTIGQVSDAVAVLGSSETAELEAESASLLSPDSVGTSLLEAAVAVDLSDSNEVPESSELFSVAEIHDRDGHHLRVLELQGADWLQRLAAEYRALRTGSRHPTVALSFDGIELLDTSAVERVLAQMAVPEHREGNFAVTRSDFGEVMLGLANTELYGATYGYRSVRDRETVQLPGRGIDQIGVEMLSDAAAVRQPERRLDDATGVVGQLDPDPGACEESGQVLTVGTDEASVVRVDAGEGRLSLVLGEAKVSAEAAHPPRVVDDADDCLRAQHLGHLGNLANTVGKIWNASRFADDAEIQQLLRIAAELLKNKSPRLRIVLASLLVRPEAVADVPSDFGTFHANADDYRPGHIRFLLVRVPGNIETLVTAFAALAGGAAA
jgi:hypothetical protein